MFWHIIFTILCYMGNVLRIEAVEENSEPVAINLDAFDYDMILPNGAVKKISFFRAEPEESKLVEANLLDDKIVGGKEIQLSEAPYQVAIMKKDSGIYCGGALYNENTVITAAHCYVFKGKVDIEEAKDKLIYVIGKSNLLKSEQCSEVLRKAFNIAIHPDFVASPAEDQINDIAIVRLSKPICLNKTDNVKAIPILSLSPDEKLPDHGLVSGWGYTVKRIPSDKQRLNPEKYSRILKQTKLDIYSKHSCKQRFSRTSASSIANHPSYFCAGVSNGSSDACQGDSGGPFVCEVNGTQYLCGVVSIGIGCGLPNTPAFYTDISYFTSWINTVTKLSDAELEKRYKGNASRIRIFTPFLLFLWSIVCIRI